ncbi:SDR family oxidoreductase [Streptococcus vestibularis]|uniref:Uncharacterized protein n=1 Tax=Streptococcus vestibularis TaxID=1343 RepID=A0A564T0V4_STRVE|nr:SDR family oxidoreductase [Streptococcus vestibularis]VUX01045.1 Uncharacterised protein [Streptococcus vestibularis]
MIYNNEKFCKEYFDLCLKSKYAKDKEILIIPPVAIDESSYLDSDLVIFETKEVLNELFSEVQMSIREMMKHKSGAVIFLLKPLYSKSGIDYSPIYNFSVESFMKSLAKELFPFNIQTMCIVLPFSSENKVQKKLNLLALKYRGITKEKQIEFLDSLISNVEILNGQSITMGCGYNLIK